jgi:hypothetical protein
MNDLLINDRPLTSFQSSSKSRQPSKHPNKSFLHHIPDTYQLLVAMSGLVLAIRQSAPLFVASLEPLVRLLSV